MDSFLYSGWVLLCVGTEEVRNLNKLLENKAKKKSISTGKWRLVHT